MVGDWLIKASQQYDRIMIAMYNQYTHYFLIQWVKDPYEANLLIEYVMEKGVI